MRRRHFLASGTALLVAGCTSRIDAPNTAAGKGSATPPATSKKPTSITVAKQLVQPGIVAMNGPDSITVLDEGGQFLLVRVETTDGPPLEQSAFSLRADGEQHQSESDQYPLYRGDPYEAGYTAESGTGWLVFPLPEQVTAKTAALTWPDGEIALSSQVRSRLETPTPTFDVTFDAPETVAEGESPTLSISVRNEGDIAGNCVLALNRSGPEIVYIPVRGIRFDLNAAEKVTKEFDAKSPYSETEDPEPVTYYLDVVGGNEISRTIEPAG
ncbi:MAG: hypothetical protein ABEH81_02995 [Halopenitus sp.]